MNSLVFFPVVLPLLGMVSTLFFSFSWKMQKSVSTMFSLLYLGLAILFSVDHSFHGVLLLGGWPKGIGITLSVDPLSSLLLLMVGAVYLSTVLYAYPKKNAEQSPLLFPMMNLLICGVSGAFLTQDLFNLYVWFEVSLIASFVLMALDQKKERLSGSTKYVVISFVSSVFFLSGAGLTYGLTKTLGFSELGVRLAQASVHSPEYVLFITGLLFCAFAIKSALFPFHFWLPASYHHASPTVSALFTGLLSKVGLYAILRVCLVLFPSDPYLRNVILLVACLTMLVGVFGAMTQFHLRRILAFHSMSQIGFMAVGGILLSSPSESVRLAGLSASLLFMFHHTLVKTSLFMVSGLVRQHLGSEFLNNMGGLKIQKPFIAALFALMALSLVGIPPSSGFWAKFSLFKASVDGQLYVVVGVMLLASFCTGVSMVKVWNMAFWAAPSERKLTPTPINRVSLVACLLLVLSSVGVGLFPDLLVFKTNDAAHFMLGIVEGVGR